MPISRSRSINELYDLVEDYDRVLTTDAPLSLALNRRIDTPRLGRFAATPRMLASGEFRPEDRRTLFLETITATDLDWKLVDHLIENILGCWEETGDLEAILEYDDFDTQATRDVLEVVDTTHSAHGDLAEYNIGDESIAVIGAEHFTALDRRILPGEYDTISPFAADETFELPEFRIFESATAIVDAIVSNISPEDAEDVAVVMDSGGRFPPLIESAFAVEDIPFHGGPGFVDDDAVRAFLRLLDVAFAGRDIRIRDVRPALSYLGVHPRIDDDDKRLDHVDDPSLEAVTEFIDSVHTSTFAEAVDFIADHSERPLIDLRDELDRLEVATETISLARVNDLTYYLQSIDVPSEQGTDGVLLSDPAATVTVDRPVVFYLGMDEDWTQRVPDRPWIDAASKDRQHLEQFQLLIQNGQDQYYLVQEHRAGQAVTPCLYFHDLLEDEFETFGELPHKRHTRYPVGEVTAFEREALDITAEQVALLSQSSLNTFVNCPRDYLFDQLVDHPHRDYFTRGNLIHDFAEFAVAHPDIVESVADQRIVSLMVDELTSFIDDRDIDLARTEFEVAVEVIRDFLEAQPPEEAEYATYSREWGENVFAEAFDRPIDSPITEQSFANHDIGIRGKVDLIHRPSRLVDHKSGSRQPSTGKLVRQASTDPVDDTPNFQAPMYLAHHRHEVPNLDLEFAFLHVLSVLDDAVTDEAAIDDALVELSYHPRPFVDYAATRDAFDALCAGISEKNNRRKTLEKLGYDAYATFFEEHDIPDVEEKDAIEDSVFCDEFIDYASQRVGPYKYVTNGIESALRQLIDIRNNAFFATDIDAIEGFIEEQRALLNEYRTSTFPVGDPNTDRLNNRDLIRPDD